MRTTVAILGATSHIAKGLICNFLASPEFSLHLYGREPARIETFLATIGKTPGKECVIHKGYGHFARDPYDVIINCIGVGTLSRLNGNFSDYFTVSEHFDNMAIHYLRTQRTPTKYISFSSGAVYGDFSAPAEETTRNCILVNNIRPEDYYSISRLNAEAKHRSFKELCIVDLRVFSYFSRYVDLSDDYFITDMLKCVLGNKELTTSASDFVRDYLHPADMFSMVRLVIASGTLNTAFDVCSSKPATKTQILDYFAATYGLKYRVSPTFRKDGATGTKQVYCSNNKNAATIGYMPRFSSMDTIKGESEPLLANYLKDI